MSRVLTIFLCLIFTFSSIIQAEKVLAQAEVPDCRVIGVQASIQYYLPDQWFKLEENATFPRGTRIIQYTFSGPLVEGREYQLRIGWIPIQVNVYRNYENSIENKSISGQLTLEVNKPKLLEEYSYFGILQQKNESGKYVDYCRGINYRVGVLFTRDTCMMSFYPKTPIVNQVVVVNVSNAPTGEHRITTVGFDDRDHPNDQSVKIENGNGNFTFRAPDVPRDNLGVKLNEFTGRGAFDFCETRFNVSPSSQPVTEITKPQCIVSPEKPTVLTNIDIIAANLVPGRIYQANIIDKDTGETKTLPTRYIAQGNGAIKIELRKIPGINNILNILQEKSYSVQVSPQNEVSSITCTADFEIGSPSPPSGVSDISDKCNPQNPSYDPKKCSLAGGESCPGDGQETAIKTAIGCIHTQPAVLVKDFIRFAIGIGGGLAFLMMLLGAFQMITSAGNPDTLKAGQDRLTSAIIGLLFIIFAVLLLQIIGVNILGIFPK